MILQETITEIQDAADVLEVVEDFVTLQKRGQNWVACCPFHDEKTPSFSVNPSRGIYKCFGCGKGGDSVSFVREIEGLGYIDALKYLAKKYGIEIKEEKLTDEQAEAQSLKESLHIVMNFAKDYFSNLMFHTSEGKTIGLSYFKERGFREEIIKKFELGYSKDEWNAFETEAQKKGYKQEILEQAGLSIRKEEKHYDRFRGRVMFPVHSLSGRVIAFGARTLQKDGQPKYLNSPETEIYHKSNVLYGIFQAKSKIRQENNCYLVEGYTDVLSLQQAGIANVVASSGTSLTENQIKAIKRFSSNITVLYDGDSAGIKASLRGIDLILEKDLDVKVVTFPQGEDPDSYVRKLGGADFKAFLEEKSTDFILFKTQLFLEDTDNDPAKKAAIIRDIVSSITKIPDEIKRQLFYQECSKILKIDEKVLVAEGNKILIKDSFKKKKKDTKHRSPHKKQERKTPTGENPTLDDNPNHPPIEGITFEEEDPMLFIPEEEKAPPLVNALYEQEKEQIRILLEYGHTEIEQNQQIYKYIFKETAEIEFSNSICNKILNKYKEAIEKGESIDEKSFFHSEDDEVKQTAIDLVSETAILSKNWKDKYKITVPEKDEYLEAVVYTNILRLKFRNLKKLANETLISLKTATPETAEETLTMLMEIKKKETYFANLLEIVIS